MNTKEIIEKIQEEDGKDYIADGEDGAYLPYNLIKVLKSFVQVEDVFLDLAKNSDRFKSGEDYFSGVVSDFFSKNMVNDKNKWILGVYSNHLSEQKIAEISLKNKGNEHWDSFLNASKKKVKHRNAWAFFDFLSNVHLTLKENGASDEKIVQVFLEEINNNPKMAHKHLTAERFSKLDNKVNDLIKGFVHNSFGGMPKVLDELKIEPYRIFDGIYGETTYISMLLKKSSLDDVGRFSESLAMLPEDLKEKNTFIKTAFLPRLFDFNGGNDREEYSARNFLLNTFARLFFKFPLDDNEELNKDFAEDWFKKSNILFNGVVPLLKEFNIIDFSEVASHAKSSGHFAQQISIYEQMVLNNVLPNNFENCKKTTFKI